MPAVEEIYARAAADGARPDPLLSVSEWADQYRKLSQRASAEPGPWRTERTPYSKEIMDCLSSGSPVETVVFIKGAQLGGTEVGNNWIGYVVHQAPGPFMAVQPTVEMAKRNSKQRIDPLIEESDVLRKLISDPRSRDSGNTMLAKEFPGGMLVMTGANSAVGLRSMAARYLFLDEIDAYPGDVDGEGSPITLALARTRTFARRKVFMVSTPKVAGQSKIESAYDESDKRRYWVPCPHCQEIQTLKFEQISWPRGEPEAAVYICEHCHEPIENHQKHWMLPRGRWIAENPGPNRAAGFHLSSLYSPVGWFSWGECAKMFSDAQKKPHLLQVFVNTVLGETWKEKGEAPEYKRLYDRRETWKIGTVPTGGLFLTAGVDVQADRLEIQVKAWGRNRENWTIDKAVLDSSRTTEDAVWEELAAFLNRTYRHESGIDLHIARVGVDSGFNTQQVYAWARKQGPGRIIVLKGQSSGAAALGTPTAVDVSSKGKRHKRGIKVWPVNVSMLKEELYGWLRLEKPSDELLANGSGYPAGYCHYPQFDEEFFKQLTAEELMVRVVKGYRVSEWQKTRDRNEALDTHNYARAAAAHVGIDRFNERDWRALEATFAESTAVEVFAQPAPESNDAPAPAPVPVPKPMPVAQPTAAPRPTQQPYQPIRSNWMNR
jgi:phage terminase large subunit GpA-like protein